MRVELKPSLNEPALPAVTDHANAAASLVEHHDFTLHVLAGAGVQARSPSLLLLLQLALTLCR